MKENDYTYWNKLPEIPLKYEVFERKAEVEANIREICKLRNRKRKLRVLTLRIVASFILLCMGLSVMYISCNETIESSTTEMNMLLSDGSEIHLLPNSRLTYNRMKWIFRRDMNLSGSAIFNIKSGPPCSVITPALTVRVVGTKFEIQESGGLTQVSCTHGKVQVTTDFMSEDLLPDESVTVYPDRFEKNSIKAELPADIPHLKPYYDSASLTEISKDISSHYNCTIDVDSTVCHYLYSGFIPNNNLDQALEIVSECCDIKFSKVDSSVCLFK